MSRSGWTRRARSTAAICPAGRRAAACSRRSSGSPRRSESHRRAERPLMRRLASRRGAPSTRACEETPVAGARVVKGSPHAKIDRIFVALGVQPCTMNSEPFQFRGDEMFCEAVPLAKIAHEVGTPVYVYSRSELERAYRAFDAA